MILLFLVRPEMKNGVKAFSKKKFHTKGLRNLKYSFGMEIGRPS